MTIKEKTSDKLISALAELIKSKRLDKVSVSELTKKANLNRGTFYLNYDDFNDFILSIEQNLLNNFDKLLDSDLVACGLGKGMPKIFNYIANHMQSFKIVCLDEVFLKKFEESIDAFVQRHNEFNNTIPQRYAETLLLNSTISIIKLWIFEQNPRSVAEITDIFYKTRKLSPIELVANDTQK
ncbi:transcriptional regulator [Leuconostoc litchii]|uniref:TetR/AcrR family transcriptional regulator n=1 Tax=Leuconostoc litchii TaxID=1981069 RepID=A0A6P2CQ48_9LACO|nr:TetR/AcrR family transcriptional regulator [Leuconostoc litchii]TYC47051.1 TetR/AcrR family transcriptional regulator [Leuconostoc litchii]GMA68984.1 transcriptional regulator [Leuconostoc litchii]